MIRGRKAMRKYLIVGATLLISACTTFSNLETGLAALVGQPFQAAIDKIGYPAGQMKVGDDTVYAWGRNFSMSMPTYNSAQTTGTVGSTPYTANTGYTSYQSVNYQCDVKIIVGPDNVIKSWQYDGNMGGCDAYASALKVRK